MKNPFRFKALETVYNSYRFRSRLEARHAVFFDTLGIKYQYEPEGFDLEGTWYLPDFYLPEQDCWVEIKGDEPTDEEINKARLLALYTQKCVGILHGEIAPPDFSNGLKSLFFRPATMWTYPKSEGLGCGSTELVQAPSYLLALLQELEKNNIGLYVEGGELEIVLKKETFAIDEIEDLLDTTQRQHNALHDAQPILREKREEIQEILTPEDGWDIEFLPQDEDEGMSDSCLWGECEKCSAFHLGTPYGGTHICNPSTIGDLLFDTPRLTEAYAAARQARFEHKKSRSEAKS